jgi:urea transport system ATP-binding protein
LRNRGDIAILLVEQYFDFARELADSFAVMERGHFVLTGDREMMQDEDVRRRLSL